MSLILNALRKLEQQDAFSSQKTAEDSQTDNADSMVSTDDGEQLTLAPIVEDSVSEPTLDSWALEVQDANEITSLGGSDVQSGDEGISVEPAPDEMPVETEPREQEEFEEDFNIPATDVGSAPTLDAWATEPADAPELSKNSAGEEPARDSKPPGDAHRDIPDSDAEAHVNPSQDLELSNRDLDVESERKDLARRADFVTEVVEAEFSHSSEDGANDESSERQEVDRFDESLPFYNPVVDAVDLDEFAEQTAPPEESIAEEWSTEDWTTADEHNSTADAVEIAGEAVSDDGPSEQGIYEDEHYFFDEEPAVEQDAASEVSADANLAYGTDEGISDAQAESPASYDTAAQDLAPFDEFSADHAPWAETPTIGPASELPAEDLNWDSPQPLANDLASEDWQPGASMVESEDRTVGQIEDELDHCNDLALSAVRHEVQLSDVDAPADVGSGTHFEDPPVGNQDVDAPSGVSAEPSSIENAPAESMGVNVGDEHAAESAEGTAVDSDPAFVAPSDYERQILERLTNSQYEQRFNDVFERIEPLVGERERICIAVVAAQPSDVTARLAAHLAVVATSRRRQRVQLIDANEDRELSLQFGREGQPGLQGLISEGDSGSMRVRTSVPTMEFLPAGISAPGEFRTLIESDPSRFQSGVAQLVNGFEVTIVDAGGVVGAPASKIAAIADVVLLIAESGETTSTQLAEAEQHLKAAGAKNVGCVLSGEYATKV